MSIKNKKKDAYDNDKIQSYKNIIERCVLISMDELKEQINDKIQIKKLIHHTINDKMSKKYIETVINKKCLVDLQLCMQNIYKIVHDNFELAKLYGCEHDSGYIVYLFECLLND